MMNAALMLKPIAVYHKLISAKSRILSKHDEGENTCMRPTGKRGDKRKISPLPFPEHIIQVVIDILREEKEAAMARNELQHSLYTHKAIEHVRRFRRYYNDLKNLSLISRQWTPLARRALGRRLVLIMDAKELRAVLRSFKMEVPFFGSWTQRVEILEIPYIPAQNRLYVEGVWKMAERIVSRLENVRTFLFSSCILGSASFGLRHVLSRLTKLEELSLWHTYSLTRSTRRRFVSDCGDGDILFSIHSPCLRRMAFRRCLPSFEVTDEQSGVTPLRDTSGISEHMRAIDRLFSERSERCFQSDFVSFEFDEGKSQWSIDNLSVSYIRDNCGQSCIYEGAAAVCADARSLSLDVSENVIPSCFFEALRRFTRLKALNLSLVNFPGEDTLTALPLTLEELYINIDTNVQTSQEPVSFDERLFKFCKMRSRTLRRIRVMWMGGRKGREKLFRLTSAFCFEHNIEFRFKVY